MVGELIFLYVFYSFAGSKESFDEPKELTKRIRETLKMDKGFAGKESNSSNSEQSTGSNSTSDNTSPKRFTDTKDEEQEKVQKCDKVW